MCSIDMVSTNLLAFLAMDKQIQARLTWIKLYEHKQDAGYVCRHCGISRPTLRKWYNHYQENGIDGLKNLSKRPHNSPSQKLTNEIKGWIIDLRVTHNLGARRIKSELLRQHQCSLAIGTIQKVLFEAQVSPIVKLKRKKKFKRYQRLIPGDRVQADTCKIAPDIYQYTAVDDCSRWRALKLYKKRANGKNTLDFIDTMIEVSLNNKTPCDYHP